MMSAVAEKIDDVQLGLEEVGAAFTTEKMLAVRGVTRAAIHEIASRCKPGLVEEDAVEMAKDILAGHGMVQGWHDVYVRFGTNTTKTFGAASDPGIVLGEDDVFLIDIGPGLREMGRRRRRHVRHRRQSRFCALRRGCAKIVPSGTKKMGKRRRHRQGAI